MLGPQSIDLADYTISVRNGFLPDEAPLTELSDSYYSSWESVIRKLSTLLHNSSLRETVDQLPILTTSHLTSEREWQRAYLILSFLTHGYIWENGGPSERLPPCISVPFLGVATHLELPPTATYAAFNLWNWAPTRPDADLSQVENLRSLITFTGSVDEEWFYLISVAIESHGAELIPLVLKAINGARADDPHIVMGALLKFGYCVREIGEILKRMYEKCDPTFFYNRIRPFLAGSKNMLAAGLPNGVFYDEGDGKGEWRQYNGGSNAQSSLIQFFDVVLGVEHKGLKSGKVGFLGEMRKYMPGGHSAFLEHLQSITNIRDYADRSTVPEVAEAFNFAVKELERFRDVHIQLVTRYIVLPAKASQPPGVAGLNIAIASSRLSGKGGLQGTGGTELIPFLKQSREETRDTTLSP